MKMITFIRNVVVLIIMLIAIFAIRLILANAPIVLCDVITISAGAFAIGFIAAGRGWLNGLFFGILVSMIDIWLMLSMFHNMLPYSETTWRRLLADYTFALPRIAEPILAALIAELASRMNLSFNRRTTMQQLR